MPPTANPWRSGQTARKRAGPRPVSAERSPWMPDDPHGAHVNPDAPRGVVEWDGQQWTPAGVAEDYTAAAQELGPDEAARRAEAVDLPRFSALPPAPEPWRPTQVFRRLRSTAPCEAPAPGIRLVPVLAPRRTGSTNAWSWGWARDRHGSHGQNS
ncbi:DUF6087 family protein [Streptomyces caniferus]|uniref:DUF6087 family protein n=1 Tax=Streptomyces caniferus TaxID=285557 RepID=UPI0039A7697A